MKFCIDCGHYAKYNTGVSNGYVESYKMWTYGHELQKVLEEYEGVEVIQTREDENKDLGVYERGQKAKGCDLFISCHSNAYSYTDQNQADKTTRVCVIHSIPKGGKDVSVAIGKALVELYKEFDPNIYYKTYTREYPNKAGVDYYGVIRGASSVGVTGIIVEHSFHTSRLYCNWATDENIKRSARVEGEAIASFYGLKKKKTESTVKPMYRVQVGAYRVKSNAEAMLKKVKEAGFTNAFIKTTNE